MANILGFLLIGLIVGWLAGVLVQGRGYGIIADILIGILGAVVGGLVFDLIGIQPRSTLGELITSVIGAVIFLAIVKAVKRI